MTTITDAAILEKIKYDVKEMITNIIIDNLSACEVDLSSIKVEFDKDNSSVIQVTLPVQIADQIIKQ